MEVPFSVLPPVRICKIIMNEFKIREMKVKKRGFLAFSVRI